MDKRVPYLLGGEVGGLPYLEAEVVLVVGKTVVDSIGVKNVIGFLYVLVLVAVGDELYAEIGGVEGEP